MYPLGPARSALGFFSLIAFFGSFVLFTFAAFCGMALYRLLTGAAALEVLLGVAGAIALATFLVLERAVLDFGWFLVVLGLEGEGLALDLETFLPIKRYIIKKSGKVTFMTS